jgi:alkanesulfonate monooxygenase
LKILPGALVITGESQAEAEDKKALLDSLVHPDSGLASLSIMLGVDASNFDLDAPLPPLPETNQSKSAQERAVAHAKRHNLTVRQLAQFVGGYAGKSFVGTPASIADDMQAWLEGAACDGFNIMFGTVPAGLDEFVDQVVPELQRRGIFRTEYEGKTLRENLGLPRPANRFFT